MSVGQLYTRFAECYEALNQDRDFEAQSKTILSLPIRVGSEMTILDLFSGPAYHSPTLNSYCKSRVISVDSSAQMRQVAIKAGRCSESEYLVGTIPDDLDSLLGGNVFDIVLALRYSIGYLSLHQFTELLTTVRSRMRPGGFFVLEIHRVDLVASEFKSANIRERRVVLENGDVVVCQWPSGPLVWDPDDWIVEMPLSLQMGDDKGRMSTEHMTSRERIFSFGDIARLVEQSRVFEIFKAPLSFHQAFEDSRIVVLRAV